MLRINLLPIRQLKKRANALNQIISILIGLGCVLLLLFAVSYYQKNNIDDANARIKTLESQQRSYQKTLDQIEKYKKNTQELNRRIAVINNLKQESSLTVHVLDELTNVIDNERIWIDSLSQNGPNLNLNGVALDNESVAQFMDALKTNPYFNSVTLGQSTLKSISGHNLKSFNLSCAIEMPTSDENDDSGKQ